MFWGEILNYLYYYTLHVDVLNLDFSYCYAIMWFVGI